MIYIDFKRLFLMSILGLTLVNQANAYDFTLNENEFNSWSLKCKALYLGTHAGKRSIFMGRVPQNLIVKERKHADSIHSGEWHYCAGLIHQQRAKQTFSNEKMKQWHYKHALSEIAFSAKSVPQDTPEYLYMNVSYSVVLAEIGRLDDAFNLLKSLQSIAPNYEQAFLAHAYWLNQIGKTSDAIKVLLEMPSDVRAKSASANYMLGLFYLDKQDIAQAQKFADVAYNLGYPLPGLKDKLLNVQKTQQ